MRQEKGGARGLDAGHSLSFYQRMWLHGWFAGASMVTAKNSIATFFEQPSAPWTLTSIGRKASEVFQFMQSHDRGVPYTPVAIVLDHLAGYNGYMDKPWGILTPTERDRQVRDLFDFQLFPGSDHIHHRGDPNNPEASYLRPTPYGEIFDVQLSIASAPMLGSYSTLLLAGDIEFDDNLVAKLEALLRKGARVLISQAHRAALGPKFAWLARYSGLEILQPWTNPETGRTAAISNDRLANLAKSSLPIEVSGDPIEYEINRTDRGWVVEVINNKGVIKKPDQPTVTDPGSVVRVTLTPKFQFRTARAWSTGKSFEPSRDVRMEVEPGASGFVEFRL